MGPFIVAADTQGGLSESMQNPGPLGSIDTSLSKKQVVGKKMRQAQSFIDLEAIKKSINRKMAQS